MPQANKRTPNRQNSGQITLSEEKLQELISSAVAEAMKQNSVKAKASRMFLSGVKKKDEFIKYGSEKKDEFLKYGNEKKDEIVKLGSEKGEKATQFIKDNINKGKENTKSFFKSLGKAGLDKLKAAKDFVARPVGEMAKNIKDSYKETKADLQYAAEQEQLKSELSQYFDSKGNERASFSDDDRGIEAFRVSDGKDVNGKPETHILRYGEGDKTAYYKLEGPLTQWMQTTSKDQMGKFLMGKIDGKNQERESAGRVNGNVRMDMQSNLNAKVEKQDFSKEDISKMSKLKGAVSKVKTGIKILMSEKDSNAMEK